MKINLTSVLVDDQDEALRFYTEIFGFVKKTDVPVGDARWLTVVSPDDADGLSCSSSRTATLPPSPSSRRSSMTASHSRRSPSTTSRPSTTDCAR